MPECPMCRAALDPSAVLCVQCGYHLQQQTFLATQVNRDTPERQTTKPPQIDAANPYATPALLDDSPQPRVTPEFDLTERGAAQATATVYDADNYWFYILLSFCCLPIFLLLLPWFGYRLYSWYQLNDSFAELRFPNSLSPHGALAVKFQNAKWKLIVGVVFGALFWLLGLAAMMVRD